MDFSLRLDLADAVVVNVLGNCGGGTRGGDEKGVRGNGSCKVGYKLAALCRKDEECFSVGVKDDSGPENITTAVLIPRRKTS